MYSTSHSPLIQAVTVNHNTSHFVELMLRTLCLMNFPGTVRLSITVLDNDSHDVEFAALKTFLDANDIPVQQTGFDSEIAVEKHGAALEDFVRRSAEGTHYLFLDSDMWSIQPDTIATMYRELDAAGETIFANQARIAGYYAGRLIEGRDGMPGAADLWTDTTTFQGKAYRTTRMLRLSPVCSLVKNTPLFRSMVDTIGLTPALRLHAGTADYFDTFSLMTHAMATHAQTFIVSTKTVNHLTQTTYMPEHRPPKDRDCLLLLNHLRGGHGMTLENFYESDWAKQQREIHTSPLATD